MVVLQVRECNWGEKRLVGGPKGDFRKVLLPPLLTPDEAKHAFSSRFT